MLDIKFYTYNTALESERGEKKRLRAGFSVKNLHSKITGSNQIHPFLSATFRHCFVLCVPVSAYFIYSGNAGYSYFRLAFPQAF